MPDKRCESCDYWTHDSGDVSEIFGEDDFSVCGANHFDDVNKKVISHKDACCEKWTLEEEEPDLTDEEIEAMLGMDPESEDDLEGVKELVEKIEM